MCKLSRVLCPGLFSSLCGLRLPFLYGNYLLLARRLICNPRIPCFYDFYYVLTDIYPVSECFSKQRGLSLTSNEKAIAQMKAVGAIISTASQLG